MSNAQEENTSKTIDITRIMEMIPHRYPFLMVDKVIDVVPHESATGVKNVTASEPHFQGHFPEKPIMPGVLIIESMAQTAAVVVVESLGQHAEGKLVYFMSVDRPPYLDRTRHRLRTRPDNSRRWRVG